MIIECFDNLHVDLNQRWIDLIKSKKVQTICTLCINNISISVTYGLTFENNKITGFAIHSESKKPLEFIEILHNDNIIQYNNITLIIRPILNYRFFYTSTDISIINSPSNIPQILKKLPHNCKKCSFCTGPFTLLQREPLAEIICKQTKREWMFHWNIAPQDYNGHFLVIPNIKYDYNKREQYIIQDDIEDLLDILIHSHTNNIHKGFFGYNSIGAGASQNHIHFHYYNTISPLFVNRFTDKELIITLYENNFTLYYCKNIHKHSNCLCSCLYIKWIKSKEFITMFSKYIIKLLHKIEYNKIPFNFIIGDECIFIFLRKYNNAQVSPYMSLGVLEYSGTFVYHSKDQCDNWSSDLLCSCLGSALIPINEYKLLLSNIYL